MNKGHAATQCERDVTSSLYCGHMRGGSWKSRFVCPVCGRESWQLLNFLGRRSVVCNGLTFTKRARYEENNG
jgi:hypothetical protein